jgi:ubiquinone/menaquinone biosynthesis C-methylase UbiE
MLEGLKLRCRSLFNSNVDISSMPTTSANIDLIINRIKLIPNYKKSIFIDFGCGEGNVIMEVAKRVKLRNILGIEINEKTAKLAKDKISKLEKKKTNIDVICSDIQNIDFDCDNIILYCYEPLWNVDKKNALNIYKNVFRKLKKRKDTYIIYISGVMRQDLSYDFFNKYKFKCLHHQNINTSIGRLISAKFFIYTNNTNEKGIKIKRNNNCK